jgi:hypothetical protein
MIVGKVGRFANNVYIDVDADDFITPFLNTFLLFFRYKVTQN